MSNTKNVEFIGACLKEFLKERNLVQEDVANQLGVSYQRVNALLNGTPFGKKVAARWEILFGVNAYWLLTGNGAMLTDGTTPPYATKIISQHTGIIPSTIPNVEESTLSVIKNQSTTAETSIVPISEEEVEVIEAEVVELPIVPTSVVRQPDIRLSKWLDKYSDEVERLRLSQIISAATMVREVKEKDMCPDLKVGQYIYLEKMSKDTPIKNGHIYFVDHSKLGGFFRKLFDRGDEIECRTVKPTYEPNIIKKEDIYDIFQVVGVFSTDIISDDESLAKDMQIASLTEQVATLTAQLDRSMAQHEVSSQNTAEALASTNRAIEQVDKMTSQQAVLIEMLKNR
jgi:transcriptional regulator with XRE-family HTH domain